MCSLKRLSVLLKGCLCGECREAVNVFSCGCLSFVTCAPYFRGIELVNKKKEL